MRQIINNAEKQTNGIESQKNELERARTVHSHNLKFLYHLFCTSNHI